MLFRCEKCLKLRGYRRFQSEDRSRNLHRQTRRDKFPFKILLQRLNINFPFEFALGANIFIKHTYIRDIHGGKLKIIFL